jgi:DNA-directed RNA polymerase III subunit RPC2
MDVNGLQVCRICGLLGYYNHKLKTPYCSMCKNGENVSKLMLPYACKLWFQVLQRWHLNVALLLMHELSLAALN